MLAAVEAWVKRDHAAEWKTWLSWLDTISKRVSHRRREDRRARAERAFEQEPVAHDQVGRRGAERHGGTTRMDKSVALDTHNAKVRPGVKKGSCLCRPADLRC